MKFSDNKIPLYTVLVKQFKNALLEVAKRSEIGHKKYIENDADYMNFKTVSIDEYDNALMRHLFEDGEDTQLEHYTAVAWNSLARLQLYLEQKNLQDCVENILPDKPGFNPEVGEPVYIKDCNEMKYTIRNYIKTHVAYYVIERCGGSRYSCNYEDLLPVPNHEYKNGYKSN